MHAPLRTLALVALSTLVASSGCLSVERATLPPDEIPAGASTAGAATGAGPGGGSSAPPGPASGGDAKPDDIAIDEGNDAAGPFTKRWTWTVEQVPARLEVRLEWTGQVGSLLLARGLRSEFVDPSGESSQNCSGNVVDVTASSGANSVCAVAKDTTLTRPDEVGAWSLEIGSDACVCHYDVHVRVAY